MSVKTLVPDADALHLEALVADERGITIVATPRGERARCPDCGQPSACLHSQRRRAVADLLWLEQRADGGLRPQAQGGETAGVRPYRMRLSFAILL